MLCLFNRSRSSSMELDRSEDDECNEENPRASLTSDIFEFAAEDDGKCGQSSESAVDFFYDFGFEDFLEEVVPEQLMESMHVV